MNRFGGESSSSRVQQRFDVEVTSQNPESTYEALKTYGTDLTSMAREGKLDPVIGRDDEIRRAARPLGRMGRMGRIRRLR